MTDETLDVNNNNCICNVSSLHKHDKDEQECKHSKFCFSKDLSLKEENLLRSPPGLLNDTSTIDKQPVRKFVTFDHSAPFEINTKDFMKGLELGSESEESLLANSLRVHFQVSDSESVSPSESEIFSIGTMYEKQRQHQYHSEIISKAEEKLASVLNQLQRLWLDIQDGDSAVTKSNFANLGNKNLLQMVSLAGFITDQLAIQYRSFANSTSNTERGPKIQKESDLLLEEELKNSKNKIKCLEAEVNYFSKENSLLNSEVKEMAYKMATSGCIKSNSENCQTNTKSPETEIFYKNPLQTFDTSESKSVANSTNNFPERTDQKEKVSSDSHNEMFILKRENEMNSLIRDFNEKFKNNTCSLHAQFQIYDEHLESWKKMLHSTNEEKEQMLQDLVKIVHEHKAVLKERDHYEFILKLLIQEKSNEDFDLQGLLQILINKLQAPVEEGNGSWIQTSLLEGAVQALQQQTAVQRDELYRLKHLLSEAQMYSQAQSKELESCNKKIVHYLDETNSNEAKMKILKEDAQQKCDKIQELCNDAISAKTILEKKLSEKETELTAVQECIKVLKKANKRQQKKYLELQQTNLMLIKEIQESKGNMDHLAEIISQLRTGLKDQKSQWDERLKITSEEAAQNKQHCEWLKIQMEQLSQQLKDAHERLKLHEMDKAQLAQQLLLAEEERRVVDRKLQELRTALQGDTGLREALIERNEALQLEINRLRHAKINGTTTATETSPPMEMSRTDELLSSILLSDAHHLSDKLNQKKNCYTSTYRRPNDFPRTAVSLHNGGVK